MPLDFCNNFNAIIKARGEEEGRELATGLEVVYIWLKAGQLLPPSKQSTHTDTEGRLAHRLSAVSVQNALIKAGSKKAAHSRRRRRRRIVPKGGSEKLTSDNKQ